MAKGYFKRTAWNENDEVYTPQILAEAILPFIPKDKVIWCPFDTKNSEFVIAFKNNGNKVIYTHIIYGQDFFNYEPNEPYDYIISNPPFSKKLEVFERLFDLGKPFAMLMNLGILHYQVVGDFYLSKNSDLQLLIPNKKVSFDLSTSMFNTSYFCKDILPKGIVFVKLEHNNSGKNNKLKKKSRMYKDVMLEEENV